MKNTLTILMLVLFIIPAVSAKKLYRWEDENGKVFYSDKVPPDQAKHERKALNKDGLVLERIGAAKTKEEIERDLELEKRRAEQKKLAEEQKKSDHVLLRTFRSEDDIIMARNGKLSSIDAKILLVRGSIRRLKSRLAEMQSSAANLERAGESVPNNMFKQIERSRMQIKNYYQEIISQEQQKQKIREGYAIDLSRFRILHNLTDEQPVVSEEGKSTNSLLETLVVCTQNCDALWEKAENYVRKHTTTRMQLLGNQIIMTRTPMSDIDISLAVSRMIKGPREEFFLDVQCKETTPGEALCASPKVQKIRTGFRSLQDQKN
jgi:hypothetical protein